LEVTLYYFLSNCLGASLQIENKIPDLCCVSTINNDHGRTAGFKTLELNSTLKRILAEESFGAFIFCESFKY
jgi:hypothetical protein